MGILSDVDAHNVDLNFNKPLDVIDAHNVVLEFGDDADTSVTGKIDTIVDTSFSVEIIGTVTDNDAVVGIIDAVVDTSFTTEILATFTPAGAITGYIDTIVDTDFNIEILASFDINFILSVSNTGQFSYQQAAPCLITQRYKWAKPIFKAHNSAFYFEQGLVQAKPVALGFDKAQRLAQAVKAVWQQGTGLSTNAVNAWDITEQLRIKAAVAWQVASPLAHQRTSVWQEMIRKRKVMTYTHQVAQVFEKRLTFKHDVGLELIVSKSLPWDKAKAVHYRKTKIEPWPEPEIPKYVG